MRAARTIDADYHPAHTPGKPVQISTSSRPSPSKLRRPCPFFAIRPFASEVRCGTIIR